VEVPDTKSAMFYPIVILEGAAGTLLMVLYIMNVKWAKEHVLAKLGHDTTDFTCGDCVCAYCHHPCYLNKIDRMNRQAASLVGAPQQAQVQQVQVVTQVQQYPQAPPPV